MINPAHTLYHAAEAADQNYSAIIHALTGKTRWTLSEEQERIPAIVDAYTAKLIADEALSVAMRLTYSN